MEIVGLFEIPTIRGMVKQRKAKSFSLKLVLEDTKIAQDFSQDILEYISLNNPRFQFLKDNIGLINIFVSDVFMNVLINFTFESLDNAKDFELAFNTVLDENYSNFLETIFLNNYSFNRLQENLVLLTLPVTMEDFKNPVIDKVVLKDTSLEISRELAKYHNTEVYIDSPEFDTPFLNIRLTKYGSLYTVKREWIKIIDIKPKIVEINSAWVMSKEFFLAFTNTGVKAKISGTQNIEVPLIFIKNNGVKIKVEPNGDDYKIISGEMDGLLISRQIINERI